MLLNINFKITIISLYISFRKYVPQTMTLPGSVTSNCNNYGNYGGYGNYGSYANYGCANPCMTNCVSSL